ncbi:hypothetical protein THAOC_19767, partial [Thalassiosira oceanica]
PVPDRWIFGDLWIFEGVCLGWVGRSLSVHPAQSPNEIDWKGHDDGVAARASVTSQRWYLYADASPSPQKGVQQTPHSLGPIATTG